MIVQEVTVTVKCATNGYFIRWYTDGWHYWYFKSGGEVYNTDGQTYSTEGNTSLQVGDNVTSTELLAIRGILSAKFIELYTDDGWKPATLDNETWKLGRADRNGQPISFVITAWLKGVSESPVVPVVVVTLPMITTDNISNIAQTTATGGGSITSDGNATVTARGVCWSTSINPTIDDDKTTDGTGTGSFVSSITGLTAETTYYVRAYATNKAGTAYGDNVVFETLALSDIKYGRLYNWYAACDSKFAPSNWKVPNQSDFVTLISNIGGLTSDGYKLKETGFDHWDSPNTDADNSTGFTARGGGIRATSYSKLKQYNYLWTLTPITSPEIHVVYYLRYNSAGIDAGYASRDIGISVRLLYNGSGTPPSQISDYDGNVYDVIQIGSQYWLKQNWACTHLNDGTEIPEVTDNLAWRALTTGAWCAYNNDHNNI